MKVSYELDGPKTEQHSVSWEEMKKRPGIYRCSYPTFGASFFVVVEGGVLVLTAGTVALATQWETYRFLRTTHQRVALTFEGD